MKDQDQTVRVELDQPELTADLAGWLSRHAVQCTTKGATGAMGSGEVALLVGTGSVAVRAALMALREWVRARRTVVTVHTLDGDQYRIDTSTGPDDIVAIIDAISDQITDV